MEAVVTSVVKRMLNIIGNDNCEKNMFPFDNFFVSFSLLVYLTTRNLIAIGTLWLNWTESCTFDITKKDERVSVGYRSDRKMLFDQWKYNSAVNIRNNFTKVSPVDKVFRWMKRKGKMSDN